MTEPTRRAEPLRGVKNSCGSEWGSPVCFKGREFAYDLPSRVELLEAANAANASVRAGCKPGDLRWSHPARDFVWFDVDGVPIEMDAYALLSLAAEYARHAERNRANFLHGS